MIILTDEQKREAKLKCHEAFGHWHRNHEYGAEMPAYFKPRLRVSTNPQTYSDKGESL